MLVNLSEIDRASFTIEERPGGLLIKPYKLKQVWKPNELNLRSLLVDAKGYVLSAGFPKFYNYGENSEHDLTTDALIANGHAAFTEKLDGSLLIRSVVNGIVHLRTRGNHDLGEFEDWLMPVIIERWPRLLNPAPGLGWPNSSYLFEVCAPENRIVVHYPEVQITLLGRISLRDLSIHRPTQEEADAFGVAMVASKPIEAQSAHEVTAAVKPLREEGVVAWCDTGSGNQHLSKFKSEWYLQAHALRSFATRDRIRDYAWARKISTPNELISALMQDGIDFETASEYRQMFHEIVIDQTEREVEVRRAMSKLAHVRNLSDRKAKAIALQERAPRELFGVLIQWAVGDDQRFEESLEAYRLGVTMNEFRELRSRSPERLVLNLASGLDG